jgi:competence protein ComGC
MLMLMVMVLMLMMLVMVPVEAADHAQAHNAGGACVCGFMRL